MHLTLAGIHWGLAPLLSSNQNMKDQDAGPPPLPKSSPAGGLKARLSRLTSRHAEMSCSGQDCELLG